MNDGGMNDGERSIYWLDMRGRTPRFEVCELSKYIVTKMRQLSGGLRPYLRFRFEWGVIGLVLSGLFVILVAGSYKVLGVVPLSWLVMFMFFGLLGVFVIEGRPEHRCKYGRCP